MNAIDGASATFQRIAGSADDLLGKLDDLSHKSATARVGLDGDKAAKLSLDDIELKLARLQKRVASPHVTVEGLARATLEIERLNLALDRLGSRRAGIGRFFFGADSSGRGGGLFGLLGSLGGGLGSIGGAIGPTAITLGIGAAGALTPALLPLLLGGLIGGGGILGGIMAANSLQQQLNSQQALANAIARLQGGKMTAANAATLRLDQARYAQGVPVGQLQAMLGPVLGVQNAFQNLGQTGLATLIGALTSQGQGFSHGPAGPSFLQSVTGILGQFAGFVKTLGPQLGDMFRATIPFLQMFTGLLETAAKTILPAVTSALKTMQPFLPIMSQGFAAVLQGVGNMIKAIGPRGMHDSAEIFLGLMRAMGGALTVFGKVLNFTAVAVFATAVKLSRWFHWLSHEIAVAFDVSRHDIAHWYDDLRHDFDHATQTIMTWAHDLAHWFDVARHTVADWVNSVVFYFKTLPGRITSALSGLPGILFGIGKAVIGALLSGLQAAAAPLISFVNFIRSLISGIGGFLGLGGGGGGGTPFPGGTAGIPGGGATGGIGRAAVFAPQSQPWAVVPAAHLDAIVGLLSDIAGNTAAAPGATAAGVAGVLGGAMVPSRAALGWGYR